jgi:hypothetical protein
VRWSNFVEIPETSSLYGYSRLFSNWYRARQKLDSTSVNSALHRISAKRVIIEITDTKNRSRSGHRHRWLMALTGGAVLTLGAVSSSLIFTTNSAPLGRIEAEQAIRTSMTSPITCQNISELAGLEVAGLREFDAGDWKVRTYSKAQTIGSVWFVNFEAACSGQVVDGLLTAYQIDSGYRILRMTPT